MKYRVNYDEDKEFTLSGKDLHTIIDKCEKMERMVNWIKDEEGNTLAEVLVPSVVTAQDLKERM